MRGWSRKGRLYVGDGAHEDDDRLLDPATEAAHIRAMLVRGDWTRRGLGRAILEAGRRGSRVVHRSRLAAATVIVKLDGAVIGDFMLRVEDAWAQAEVAGQARDTQAELGWVLDPAYTGHGYATEAVRELLVLNGSDGRDRPA